MHASLLLEVPDIAVVGMGYVGLTLAVGLAEAGYRVHGIENHPATLASLRAGIAHVKEPGLPERFARYVAEGTITIHETLDSTCAATAFIITVGTPMGTDRRMRMDAMQQVSRSIANVLKPGDLVILRSTVKIGTSRTVVKPILDTAAVPYHLAMCPERTVEGKALQELRTLPQIIGGLDAASAARAAALFQRMTPETVTVSSLEAAELTKLVCNTQRDLFFAYANEVAHMADAVGVNASEVIHAANHQYPRSRIAQPGLVGGPCLGDHAHMLAESMAAFGIVPRIVMAGRAVNEEMIAHGMDQIRDVMRKQHRSTSAVRNIAVLGLAFKGTPETDDLRGSLAIPLMATLHTTFPNARVVGYDPAVSVEKAAQWGLTAEATLDAALSNAELVVIQTNHAAFCGDALRPYITRLAPRAMLYDFWGCTAADLAHGTDVYHMGLGFDYGRTTEQRSETIAMAS